MFELFTQPARQVIFFARYETSQFGAHTIETEHLLLGLIRVDKDLLRRLLPDSAAIEEIRVRISLQVEIREKTSTSVDMPLSEECKRILGYAAEEAETVGTGQILLGILREADCTAAKLLVGMGLRVDSVREEVARKPAPVHGFMNLQSLHRHEEIPRTSLPAAGVVPDDETAKRIAEAVWMPRVSGGLQNSVAATNATLAHGVWIVTGTRSDKDAHASLAAFIQKEDGKILRLHQEKLDS